MRRRSLQSLIGRGRFRKLLFCEARHKFFRCKSLLMYGEGRTSVGGSLLLSIAEKPRRSRNGKGPGLPPPVRPPSRDATGAIGCTRSTPMPEPRPGLTELPPFQLGETAI